MRLFLSVLCVLCAAACVSLSDRTRETFEAPGLEGARWGLLVTTADGRELVAINADQRFLPASTVKLFTVAAAFDRLGDMSAPDPASGASVRIEPRPDGPPDVALIGGGDATLIDAPDCLRNCLSILADLIAAQGVAEFGHVIVDTTLFPHEPWPPGWSEDDLVTRSGAPVSALAVNSNELRLVVRPGPQAGAPASVAWQDGAPPLPIANDVVTVESATTPDDIVIERPANASVVRAYGRINTRAEPVSRPVAVDDPGLAAGLRLVTLLEARGVKVRNGVVERRRPVSAPNVAAVLVEPARGVEVARLIPPPLIENVTFLMKQSQNLHAELLLRRLGLVEGDGSREAGLAIVKATIGKTGVPRWSWDLVDGSGMSVYNRLTPRAVVILLLWTQRQPWADAFRATLPVGGVDGTLARRFAGTSLEGRIFAKTGTLMGANALSGFMQARSGRMLAFSAFANDRPSEAGSALPRLDAALLAVAEAN